MAVNNVFQMLAQQEMDRPARRLQDLQIKQQEAQTQAALDSQKYQQGFQTAMQQPSLSALGTPPADGMGPMQQEAKPPTLLDGLQRAYNYHIANNRPDLAKAVHKEQLDYTLQVADTADRIHKQLGPQGVAAWMKANPEVTSVLGDMSTIKLRKDGVAYPVTKDESNEIIPGKYWMYIDGRAQMVEDKPQPLQTIAPGYGVADGKGGFTVPIPKEPGEGKETWGPPEEMTIGGKKAMVQKSSTGQVRPVIQDTSTTVKVETGNGQGKAPAGYRWKPDGNLEAILGGPAEAKAEAAKQGKEKAKGAYDASITVVDKLLAHPGRKTATGLSAKMDPRNYTAGTDAYDFQKELESFDAVLFLSNIEKMKGMGALSNAEGAKVSSAAGAIKPGMSEKAFEANLRIIKNELSKAKTRIDGGAAQPAPANPGPKLSKKAQSIADRY